MEKKQQTSKTLGKKGVWLPLLFPSFLSPEKRCGGHEELCLNTFPEALAWVQRTQGQEIHCECLTFQQKGNSRPRLRDSYRPSCWHLAGTATLQVACRPTSPGTLKAAPGPCQEAARHLADTCLTCFVRLESSQLAVCVCVFRCHPSVREPCICLNRGKADNVSYWGLSLPLSLSCVQSIYFPHNVFVTTD